MLLANAEMRSLDRVKVKCASLPMAVSSLRSLFVSVAESFVR